VVIWICNFLVLNLVILDLYCLGVFGIWICLVLEYLCGYWICNFLVLNLDLYCLGELGVLVIWIWSMWICLVLEFGSSSQLHDDYYLRWIICCRILHF
jgi:hypothetical protein